MFLKYCFALVAVFSISLGAGAGEAADAAPEASTFQSARPIWPKGREAEMNLLVGFRAVIETPQTDRAELRVAASTLYRAWLNGELLGHGPARGPHGYYRVDQWDLSGRLRPGKNLIAIEVAGYNSNSYYLLNLPSFLQAEVARGDKVLASTAGEGVPLDAAVLDYRVQKVQRYSFQRPFIEVYRLAPESHRWIDDPAAAFDVVETATQPEKKLLARRVLYPEFKIQPPARRVGRGRFEKGEAPKKLWKDRSLVNVGPELKGFPEEQLAVIPTIEMQSLHFKPGEPLDVPFGPDEKVRLDKAEYEILDLGINRTGFVGATVTCDRKTRLWFVFDEVLTEGDVNFRRLGCANIVDVEMEPGTYRLETMEPYTLRYLKLMCLDGKCEVQSPYLREYGHPPVAASFASSDERLNRLFQAGVETFRQNTLDVFMDCPSRERAGWLCDSFFTARVACDLTGEPRVERVFFENFLLPERFAHLPEGMLPMCYPADHDNGNFIPNWALWFVVQLEEYAARTADRSTVDRLELKVRRLMDFFRQYENSDGLLEKLPGWVFVEWSAANRFVQDVNYPSNMLYAAALGVAGRIYKKPELVQKAERIRQTIREQSFDGQFFVDNALRKDGKLEITRNRSEVCQYFAFYFDVATPESHAELWRILQDRFGPERKDNGEFPEIHLANAFIGNMLRMELLSRAGRSRQILDESVAYLLYMANRTGTLWEHQGDYASCNHGFASHICHTLYRDVLGLYHVDRVNRRVKLRFGALELETCEGCVPTPGGEIRLSWHKEPGKLIYRLGLPEGYEVETTNLSGRELVREK